MSAAAEPDEPAELARLRQSWWLHDARWYQGVKERFGAQAANELNAAALKFVARRIAATHAKEHASGGPMTAARLAEVLDALARTMFSRPMLRMDTTGPEAGVWETTISEHFALKMLKATRSLHEYQCPCLDLRAGWFEGLGVQVRDEVVACLRTGDEVCRFRACLKEPEQSTSDTEAAAAAPSAEAGAQCDRSG